MIARIPHDLGRGVKTQRLRVQKRRAEDVRVPAFEPRGGVGDQREGRRMAFRKAVAAEAFELLEGLNRKVRLVAVCDHAPDKLLTELRHTAGMLDRSVKNEAYRSFQQSAASAGKREFASRDGRKKGRRRSFNIVARRGRGIDCPRPSRSVYTLCFRATGRAIKQVTF